MTFIGNPLKHRLARDATFFTGTNIISKNFPIGKVRREYVEVLSEELYPKQKAWSDDLSFFKLLDMSNIITLFCVADGRIVALGQAILVPADPNWQVLISNMVTLKQYRRRKYGTAVDELLRRLSVQAWGTYRGLTFVLTNNKGKGNSEFYTRRGWVQSDTTVYVYAGK